MQITKGTIFPLRNSSARLIDSTKVFTKISDAVCGSNVRWRGRSFAASVPSNSSTPQRENKRISKDDRHAMVKALVDKYRASNDGKFPTPSYTKKQVGGSYYTIKYILQKLEYQSKIAPISKRDETLLEKEEVSEETLESLPKVSPETILKSSESLHPCSEVPEDSRREESTSKDSLDLNRSKEEFVHEAGQKSPKSDKFDRDISRKENEEQAPRSSTVWGNLKSIADGIFNMWRKM